MTDISDKRLRKDAGTVHASRDDADASRVEHDGLALTSAERRKMIAQDWVSEVLPTPPKIDGYHLFWASTTNSTDPIYRRLRMGYQPVKVEEVKGMELYKATGGDFDGCVQCNEMLLLKIPDEVYQDIMTVFHHEKPREAELSIKDQMQAAQQYDSDGNELVKVEEGVKRLGMNVRAPNFA